MPLFKKTMTIKDVARMKEEHDIEGLANALLYKGDFYVSWHARHALEELKDPQSVEPLLAILDEDPTDAIYLLGHLGDGRAILPIIRYLGVVDMLEEASEALTEIGASAIAPLLEVALQESPLISPEYSDLAAGWARSILGKIDDPRATEALIAILGAESVRYLDRLSVDMIIQDLEGKKPPEMGMLKRLYREGNGYQRLYVTRALQKIGDAESIEFLTVILDDKWTEVSQTAAAALKTLQPELGNESQRASLYAQTGDWQKCLSLGSIAIPAMVKGLRQPKSEGRDAGVKALVGFGEPALQPLIDALDAALVQGSNIDIDGWIEALALLGDVRAVDVLIRCLDVNWGNTLLALAVFKEPRVVDALVHFLKKPYHISVKKEAINSLAHIGAPAVEALIGLLYESDEELVDMVIHALGLIKDKRATAPLIKRLQNDDDNQTFRWWILQAMKSIQDPRCIPAIIESLPSVRSDPTSRYDQTPFAKISQTLIQIGGPEVDLLIPQLSSPNPHIRQMAIEVLENCSQRENIQLIVNLFKDDGYGSAAKQAANQLGKVGDGSTVPLLFDAIRVLEEQHSKLEKEAPRIIEGYNRLGSIGMALVDCANALIALYQSDRINSSQKQIIHNKRDYLVKLGRQGGYDFVKFPG